MTGVAADAEDLVQETFLRALESPPVDRSRELGPWLTRVAMNASRDLLRRRKTQGYRGPWLPSPVDTESLPDEQLSPSARYGQLESLSYAFMVALEALSATQRGVVILRDVLDYSVVETADALGLSEANVKTTHHRARAAVGEYEAERAPLTAERRALLQGAMTRLFLHLGVGDVRGAQEVLSATAVAINDGGGEFFAAQRPIRSPQRIVNFMRKTGSRMRVLEFRLFQLNGQPAVYVRRQPDFPKVPPYSVHLMQIDDEARISRIYSVLATRKLMHLGITSPA
jgi:RNA polymerase sigma-70 factor (ECF subfamily)